MGVVYFPGAAQEKLEPMCMYVYMYVCVCECVFEIEMRGWEDLCQLSQ